jgi:hypothetical protein
MPAQFSFRSRNYLSDLIAHKVHPLFSERLCSHLIRAVTVANRIMHKQADLPEETLPTVAPAPGLEPAQRHRRSSE